MGNIRATFSRKKLTKAIETKWPTCPSERLHIELATALSKHLGRYISTSQAKGWLSGVRPGSDTLKVIAQVLGRKLEWFYE